MVVQKLSASRLPSSWKELRKIFPWTGDALYIFFIVDNDAATGKPWCPDVRAALPVIEKFFAQRDALELVIVSVGSRAAWKDPKNVYRTKWDLKAVPTLVKYTATDDPENGSITQAQLVEEDAKDVEKLLAFTK